MSKYFVSLVMLAFLVTPSWSQEDSAAGETIEETEAPDPSGPAETVVEDEAADDADLDQQTYDEDDDDFVPTEEIPADEPIPFPSNI
jgi:hypothetical protein